MNTAVPQSVKQATLQQYQLDDAKPEARFDEIVEQVVQTCGVAAGALVFLGQDSTVIKSSIGISLQSRPNDQSVLVQEIMLPMRTVVVNDASENEVAQADLLESAGQYSIQAFAGMPVLAPNGVAIGAFLLMDFAPHNFTMLEVEALARASRRVVELLESNKMAVELANRQQTAYPDNSREIVAELVDEMLKDNGWWAARAYWAEEGQLHPEAWRFESASPQSIRRLAEQPAPANASDDGLQFPKPVLLNIDQATWLGDQPELKRAGVRNVVVIDVAGVLSFALRLVFVVPNTQALTPDILASLSTASLLLPKVIRQERARGELHYRATHDALTGLLNRRGLEQVIEPIEQSQNGAIHAVIYLDLDRFKSVNDTHGHEVGDEVLGHVSADLVKQIRPTDVLARLGGDEFVWLALNVESMAGAQAAAKRILEHVNGAFRTKSGLEIPVAVSLGVSLWRSGESFQNALRISDALMYRAKQQGGGVVAEEATGSVPPGQAGQAATVTASTAVLSLVPNVHISPICIFQSSDLAGYIVQIESSLRNPEPKQISELLAAQLTSASIDVKVQNFILQFPNHFWSHSGLIEEIIGELRVLDTAPVYCVSLDCSLASPSVRQVALQLKQRTRVELVLTNFGSGPNELMLLDLLEPTGLGLAKDAVASLGTLEPKVTNLKTTVAIATALNLQTFAFDLNSQAQARQLAQLGCNQLVFAKSASQKGNE